MTRRGNCYVTTEALYHILGGRFAGWVPHVLRLPRSMGGDTHWFLRHSFLPGLILDPSRLQFGRTRPPYERGRGTGFLTKRPSKRARALMETMTWQSPSSSLRRNPRYPHQRSEGLTRRGSARQTRPMLGTRRALRKPDRKPV